MMIIKLLPKGDLPELVALRGRIMRKRPFYLFKKWYTQYPELFVACYQNKKMIGFAYAKSWYTSIVLGGIGVEAKYRKKGVGSKLLKFLEKQLKKLKITKYSALIASKNISFYKENGFLTKIKKVRRGKNCFIIEKTLKV